MAALARLNPVKPPKVNRNKNPIAKRLHVVVLIAPVHKVPSQLNIFTLRRTKVVFSNGVVKLSEISVG